MSTFANSIKKFDNIISQQHLTLGTNTEGWMRNLTTIIPKTVTEMFGSAPETSNFDFFI